MVHQRFTHTAAIRTFCLLAGVFCAADAPAQLERATERDSTQGFAPAVAVTGNPRERGLAYGKGFSDGIHRFLDKEIRTAFVDRPASQAEMLQYAAACGQVVRDECPVIADEFAGIAEGAGLTFEEVMLINLHEELYHRTGVPQHGHCTAVAVAPPDTGNAQTYVGQTWDWMESVAGHSSVVLWQRDEGASVLAYGFPGMPMGAGLNSAGIALCWTSANLQDHQTIPRVGLPSYVLIAHLLCQKDLDGVIRAANQNKHAGWFTFVVADGDGNLVNIEGSPGGITVERAKERLVRVSYGTRQMTGTSAGASVELHPRCRKMYELLGSSAGENDLERLQQYFTHPEYEICAGKATIDMMVFDTTARVAYLSRGPGYRVAWREFRFSPPR